jgi:meiotic recombination protein REC8
MLDTDDILPQIPDEGDTFVPSTVIISTESDEAHNAPQRKKRLKLLKQDRQDGLEISRSEIKAHAEDYLQSMLAAQQLSLTHKIPAQAKKNADYWILGAGLGGVGKGIGADGILGPLATVFSGNALFELITGIHLEQGAGQKRPFGTTEEETDTDRRVRPRSEEYEGPRYPVMTVYDSAPIDGFDDIEIAREPGSAMEDVSSAMPWNITGSIRGSSLAYSAVRQSSASRLLAARYRMLSPSPLARRAIAPLEENDLSMPVGGYDSSMGDDSTEEDSRAAMLAALDKDSGNFLAHIATAIQKVAFDEEQQAAELDIEPSEVNEILFSLLLPPELTQAHVAAHAFLHVLTLGTKNLLRVKQNHPFGEMSMKIIF